MSLHFAISLAIKATFECVIPTPDDDEIERKCPYEIDDDEESQTNPNESNHVQTRTSGKWDQCLRVGRKVMRWTMALFSLITCTAGSTLVIGFQQQYIDQDTNLFENCKNAKPPVMSD